MINYVCSLVNELPGLPGRFLFFLGGGGWFGDIAKGGCCEYKVLLAPATNSFLLLEDMLTASFDTPEVNCDILSSNIITLFIIIPLSLSLSWYEDRNKLQDSVFMSHQKSTLFQNPDSSVVQHVSMSTS